MKYSIFVLISVFVYSCVSGQRESNSVVDEDQSQVFEQEYDYLSQLEKDFIGEWTNVSMRIWVKTYNNSDTSFIVDITEENWELKMNVKYDAGLSNAAKVAVLDQAVTDRVAAYTTKFTNLYDFYGTVRTV